jgi:hypothetical protein
VHFIYNCIQVLIGRKTWVGYSKEEHEQSYLPAIRPAVLPPYNIIPGFEPSKEVKAQMNLAYAQNYNASHDLNFILRNLRFLGRKS